ncbi:T9SS type A sorting domain-containing protein [Ferruginibacter sp.]
MSKLTTIALLFVLSCSVFSSQAQRNASKRTTVKRASTKTTNHVRSLDYLNHPVEADESEPVWPTPECTQTKSINTKSCDAYPWLSADALRIYYTSNRDGGHGNIYYTERTSVDQPFPPSNKLFPDLENKYYAVSLTNDELTMILTLEGYTIYISERKSKKDAFSKPRPIDELQDNNQYAPGISPDGKELMVITDGSKKASVGWKGKITDWYERNAAGVFVKKGSLQVPEGMVPGPGQFGKDGLTYYCSLEKKEGGQEKLYCFTRKEKAMPFEFGYELPQQVNVNKANLQPSMNEDGTILAYCINNTGMWDGDDIRVVNLDQSPDEAEKMLDKPVAIQQALLKSIGINTVTAPVLQTSVVPFTISYAAEKYTVANEPQLLKLAVYPNPFNSQFSITIPKLSSQNTVLELYDAGGKRMLTQKITANITVINTGKIPAGVYKYRVADNDSLVSSGTLMAAQ